VLYPGGCHNTRGNPGSINADEKQIEEFVQNIFASVKNSGEYICEGLFRIDVMYNKGLKKMVVNELESLEAGHDCGKPNKNAKVSSHLGSYWETIIRTMLGNLET
jgi:hypothetical protein